MATQTSTTSIVATTTTTVQQEPQPEFNLTERIVPWKVPKLAAKHATQESDGKHFPATSFLLDIAGLSAPPLVIPGILLLLSTYREIPVEDHAFSIGFALYLCLANKFRFDKNAKQIALRKSRGEDHPEKPEWFINAGAWFDKYMASAAVLGLVMPLALQLLAPSPVAQAAAPHLYVLLFQILMEIMGNGPHFHPMLQVAVPIGYSAYRIGSLKTWLAVSWGLMGQGSSISGTPWAVAHFGLALINVLFWTYNTFVMLLLRVLPPCLDGGNFPDADIRWKYHLVPVLVNETDGTSPKTRTD